MSKTYTNNNRADIFEETLKHLRDDEDTYRLKVSRINESRKMPENSGYNTDIQIVSMSILDAVIKFSNADDEYYSFVYTATASNKQFSSDCKQNGITDEEEFCRRTSISNCFKLIELPLPEYGAIYCEDVAIIRDSEKNDYMFYDEESQCFCNCIIVSPIYMPKLTSIKSMFTEPDLVMTLKKISHMLSILVNNEQTHLVLGSYGYKCDNPPEQIANIFKYLLSTEFKGRFVRIVFAVTNDQHSDNYDIYTRVFNSEKVIDYSSYMEEDEIDINMSRQLNKDKLMSRGKARDRKFI